MADKSEQIVEPLIYSLAKDNKAVMEKVSLPCHHTNAIVIEENTDNFYICHAALA